MSRIVVARTLSVLGHPVLLMPVAVLWSALIRDAPPPMLRAAVGAAVGIAVVIAVYSVLQVRAGRWTHADASLKHERHQLNRFLLALLFGASALLWRAEPSGVAALGMALGTALVLLGLALRRRMKVSLHAAFAVYAAALPWPNATAVLLLIALAAGVAWSRVVLRRHTRPEVVIGVLAGGAAGLAFNLLTLSRP